MTSTLSFVLQPRDDARGCAVITSGKRWSIWRYQSRHFRGGLFIADQPSPRSSRDRDRDEGEDKELLTPSRRYKRHASGRRTTGWHSAIRGGERRRVVRGRGAHRGWFGIDRTRRGRGEDAPARSGSDGDRRLRSRRRRKGSIPISKSHEARCALMECDNRGAADTGFATRLPDKKTTNLEHSTQRLRHGWRQDRWRP